MRHSIAFKFYEREPSPFADIVRTFYVSSYSVGQPLMQHHNNILADRSVHPESLFENDHGTYATSLASYGGP